MTKETFKCSNRFIKKVVNHLTVNITIGLVSCSRTRGCCPVRKWLFRPLSLSLRVGVRFHRHRCCFHVAEPESQGRRAFSSPPFLALSVAVVSGCLLRPWGNFILTVKMQIGKQSYYAI